MQQEKYGDRLMQIVLSVGHKPRPPSRSDAASSPFLPFFFFPVLSRSGATAGVKTIRYEKRPASQARGHLHAFLAITVAVIGFWNSIGAVSPHRWIVRANRDGL